MGVWMLDNVFPECVWANFGEHVGANEFNEHADLVSSPIMVFSWTRFGLAQRKGRIVSGPAGPSRAVLGSSGSCVYMLLETSSGTHWSSITAGSFDVEDAIDVGSPKSLMRVSGKARWIV